MAPITEIINLLEYTSDKLSLINVKITIPIVINKTLVEINIKKDFNLKLEGNKFFR